ncbi:S-layer homology domain-containing protein [Paenibacillus sp. 1P03SA]|uniref:S-layer homology domain-containing protein n=1 Tax=Paenibacillus sp. 1P03SA TaxID=3132294 RepID=UPI0039A1908F
MKTKLLSLKIILAVLLLLPLFPAGPARAGLTSTPFPDVDSAKYSWAVQSITFMAQSGILQGYPDGTFQPGRYVSKAEWSVMVYRLFDKYRPSLRTDVLNYSRASYGDVPASHWAYREISDTFVGVADTTVTSRNGNPLFNPEYAFTRWDLALMLYGLYGIDGGPESTNVCGDMNRFKDITTRLFNTGNELESFRKTDSRYNSELPPGGIYPILFLKEADGTCGANYDDYSALAANSLLEVHKTGILTADANGKFYPSSKLTRAEAVTVLHRILDHLKTQGVLGNYSSINPSGILRPVPMPAPKPGEAAEGPGPFDRDLQRDGEFNTIVYPNGKKYMRLELTSKDAVDLYLYMNGDIAFLRQEELPRYVQVDRVSQIGIKSQSRNPEKRSPLAAYPATLKVTFHDEIPATGTGNGTGTGTGKPGKDNGGQTGGVTAPPGAAAVQDLKSQGEINRTFAPNGSKYMNVNLVSQDKVDVYVQLGTGTAFLKQEELPAKINVLGMSSVTVRTQSRNPEKRTSQQTYNAYLYVTFSN